MEWRDGRLEVMVLGAQFPVVVMGFDVEGLIGGLD